MRFFVDTANIDDIKRAFDLGIITGVTTNPVLIRREGTQDIRTRIEKIRACIGDGEILTQVVARDTDEILRQAKLISTWDPNITIKVPLTLGGIPAIAELSKMNIRTCATVVFDAAQTLAAAAAGATYVAAFLNRTNALGIDGFKMMEDIIDAFKKQETKTQVVAASVENAHDILRSVKLGADVVTAPYSVYEALIRNTASYATVEEFLTGWSCKEI